MSTPFMSLLKKIVATLKRLLSFICHFIKKMLAYILYAELCLAYWSTQTKIGGFLFFYGICSWFFRPLPPKWLTDILLVLHSRSRTGWLDVLGTFS